MLRLLLAGQAVLVLVLVFASCKRDTFGTCEYEGSMLTVGETVMRDCATCVCRDDGFVYCDGTQCPLTDGAAPGDAAEDAAAPDAGDAGDAADALVDGSPDDGGPNGDASLDATPDAEADASPDGADGADGSGGA
jgi:hypothetical protein